MLILVLNCGSSSLKFALYEAKPGEEPAPAGRGSVAPIGEHAWRRTRYRDDESDASVEAPGHADAARVVLEWLEPRGARPSAVGHRVVHGGRHFREASRLDGEALDALEEARRLAPLHNGPALDAIAAVREALPGVPQFASFDTAFHAAMPAHASHYAIPLALAERHGLYRFGFHGLAHQSMAMAAARLLGRPLESLRLVTLQLGAGCSAAAISGGRSVDTTMGVTPLEGLVMATRSGDVDPALPGLLARAEGMSLDAVEDLLYERSGLLGVSGRSGDVRDLLRAEADGDEQATLALELYCYRIRKQVGAYIAALGGADAVVFGGGVGEHQPEVRRRACLGLGALGVVLDPEANARAQGGEAEVGDLEAAVRVLVAAVDEERLIARDVLRLLAD